MPEDPLMDDTTFKNYAVKTADELIGVVVGNADDLDDDSKFALRRMFFSGLCYGMIQPFGVTSEEAADVFQELVKMSEGL